MNLIIYIIQLLYFFFNNYKIVIYIMFIACYHVVAIFRILEVIDRFITFQFHRRCNQSNSLTRVN